MEWAAVLLLATLSPAQAAGLGKLTLASALGETLSAEIDVLSAPDDSSTLTPRLSSPDTYRAAGLAYNPALSGSRVEVRSKTDGRRVIAVVSPRPLNEPFVYLLVELGADSSRMLRAYTLLLDPPNYSAPPPTANREFPPAAVSVAATATRIVTTQPAKVDRPRPAAKAPSRERLSDTDARALAEMLERITALELAVAQLQRQWEKPEVVAAQSAPPPARNPLAVKVSPPVPPPQAPPAAPVEPAPRSAMNADSLLNTALLVLAIGLLILLGGLVWVLWGRPAAAERRVRAQADLTPAV